MALRYRIFATYPLRAPHRTLGVDENDELIDNLAETKTGYDGQQDFATIILEHLNTSGVQQARRDARLSFTALTSRGWMT